MLILLLLVNIIVKLIFLVLIYLYYVYWVSFRFLKWIIFNLTGYRWFFCVISFPFLEFFIVAQNKLESLFYKSCHLSAPMIKSDAANQNETSLKIHPWLIEIFNSCTPAHLLAQSEAPLFIHTCMQHIFPTDTFLKN